MTQDLLQEAQAVIVAQEKLASQQAHEIRDRYSPAIANITTFLETEKLVDFLALKPDMNISRHLLLEIEEMIRSRLDCYKILRGKFVPRTERFRL